MWCQWFHVDWQSQDELLTWKSSGGWRRGTPAINTVHLRSIFTTWPAITRSPKLAFVAWSWPWFPSTSFPYTLTSDGSTICQMKVKLLASSTMSTRSFQSKNVQKFNKMYSCKCVLYLVDNVTLLVELLIPIRGYS